MIPTDGFAQVEVRSAAELRNWLAAHHGQAESVWLVTWKKAPGAPFVSVGEVLDELIAFGWIDGLRRKPDADRTMQLISPRKQQAWAQTYKDRVQILQDAGRMAAPGLAAVAASQALGLWNAYADVDLLLVPQDLRVALDGLTQAAVFFDAAAPSYRRNVLRWIHSAKRPETRAARIAKTLEASAERTKLPQM